MLTLTPEFLALVSSGNFNWQFCNTNSVPEMNNWWLEDLDGTLYVRATDGQHFQDFMQMIRRLTQDSSFDDAFWYVLGNPRGMDYDNFWDIMFGIHSGPTHDDLTEEQKMQLEKWEDDWRHRIVAVCVGVATWAASQGLDHLVQAAMQKAYREYHHGYAGGHCGELIRGGNDQIREELKELVEKDNEIREILEKRMTGVVASSSSSAPADVELTAADSSLATSRTSRRRRSKAVVLRGGLD